MFSVPANVGRVCVLPLLNYQLCTASDNSNESHFVFMCSRHRHYYFILRHISWLCQRRIAPGRSSFLLRSWAVTGCETTASEQSWTVSAPGGHSNASALFQTHLKFKRYTKYRCEHISLVAVAVICTGCRLWLCVFASYVCILTF